MADEVRRVLVTLDAQLHDAGVPQVYVDDLAVLRGDGVFETLLVRAGRACVLEPHLSRLRHSAEMVDLPEPNLVQWRRAIATACEAWGSEQEGVMRLVFSRGRESGDETTAFVTIGAIPEQMLNARMNGVSVMTLQRGYSTEFAQSAPWQLLGAKTLSYAANMAATRFARRCGADDAIFISTEGRVLEGTRSAVLVVRDNTLITPPAKFGIVPSTTQRALFAAAEQAGFDCEYAPLFAADLILADGVWLLSSTTLAARVHTLDGLSMSEPEIARRITELVDEGISNSD